MNDPDCQKSLPFASAWAVFGNNGKVGADTNVTVKDVDASSCLTYLYGASANVINNDDGTKTPFTVGSINISVDCLGAVEEVTGLGTSSFRTASTYQVIATGNMNINYKTGNISLTNSADLYAVYSATLVGNSVVNMRAGLSRGFIPWPELAAY